MDFETFCLLFDHGKYKKIEKQLFLHYLYPIIQDMHENNKKTIDLFALFDLNNNKSIEFTEF